MAFNRIWLVLLGTQLSYVDSVGKITTDRHGTVRFHPRQTNHTQSALQPLLHVVNRTSLRHKSVKTEKKPRNAVAKVTALFSSTFSNIFSFQEKRPLPVAATVVKSEDYESAYEDYISSIIGSDLESAVNGDGKEEYYYEDDYIDYEFDSISQIEDTTHGTPKSPEIQSSKSRKQLQLLFPAPLVLFSIALTLFGLLQILFAKHKNSQSGNMSCLPDDVDECDECVYVIAESTKKSVESGLIDEEPLSM